jgi:hypothetical protein
MLGGRRLLTLAAAALSLVVLGGCANNYTCVDYKTCPPEGGLADARTDARDGSSKPMRDGRVDAKVDGKGMSDGGADVGTPDGGGDAKGDVSTCDGTQPPSTTACVISETYGVFVAPAANGGNDTTGSGTRTAPYATITKALSSLGALARVYVCNGSYTDQVTVTGAVGIFGGLTCGSIGVGDSGTAGPWVYASGTKGTVTGAAPAFALEVNAGSNAVDAEDMEFDGAPGTSASLSSIAAFATGSSNVTLRRVTLTAGTGAAGASGTAGATGTLVSTSVGGVVLATPSLNGQPATSSAGGPATTCTCSVSGTSTGGAGGDSTNAGAGQNGLPAQSTPTPATATGAGSTEGECSSVGTNGAFGSSAVPTIAGDGASAIVGTVDASGWHPGSGVVGTNGGPGQGGGGGGGVIGGNGGGGACGGCGGVGGGFGTGGGGSIALLAFDSPVQLFSATLTSSTGGAGGGGAGGGAGIAGGARGAGTGTACNGGNGGLGSTGGAGGGGAGGVSIGILYQGAAPVPDAASMITPGTAGALGTGGDPGTNDGAAGVSVATENASSL